MACELSPRATIKKILLEEVRPNLDDPHSRRQRRFRIYEKILVRLLQSAPGEELDVLWSLIQQAAEQEPWRTALRRALKADRPHYRMDERSENGQMKWDLSKRIAVSATGSDDFRTTSIRTLGALLEHRPLEAVAEEDNRIRLSFLTKLYIRLTGGQ